MNEVLAEPQPDPSWDYYEMWFKLVEAKIEIDRALELIKALEKAENSCDLQVNTHVQNAISALQEIVVETDLYEV